MSDGPRPKDYRYLTVIQKRYYDFIRHYIAKHDIAPTMREMANHFGVNQSTASRMIKCLRRSGAIYAPPGVARGIRPLQLKHREVRDYKVAFTGFAAKRSYEANGVSTDKASKNK